MHFDWSADWSENRSFGRSIGKSALYRPSLLDFFISRNFNGMIPARS